MTAQRPTSNLLDDQGRSYTLLYSEGFDYITQLPGDSPDATGGMVMLGGGLFQAGDNGFCEIGEGSDEGVSLMACAHVSGVLGAVTGRLGGFAVEDVWTGSLGFTPDGMAWVGEVPERIAGRKRPAGTEREVKDGGILVKGREWVAAGFSGEGMVNSWLSGVALGKMVLGGKEDEVGLPRPMLITEKRVKSADLLELAQEWLV